MATVPRSLRSSPRRDPLTGLATRDHLLRGLRRALAQAAYKRRDVAVLFIDLDGFKLVNDTLGHAAGDRVLRDVASAMSPLAKDADVVARLGGDEFAVVLGDLDRGDEETAKALGRRLRTGITRPRAFDGVELRVGVSIGIAISAPGLDEDELLERADQAMYAAKREGRNRVVVYQSGHGERSRVRERDELALTVSLPRAIERDELVLHWQPIADPASGHILGLEALVRWEHPDRGLLAPGAFIPFAERTGRIAAIDEWVARALSIQRLRWQRIGLDPYVGFNLSAATVRLPGQLEALITALTMRGLDLGHVTAELTESAALHEDDRAMGFVHGLHASGVTLSLDDFGEAYSSLARVRDLPVRWIKVDRGFLREATQGQGPAVLEAVLNLVRALGLDVIVEGVETEAQRRLLVELGVSHAQGFHLGRPVPAAEITRLLDTQR